MGIAPELGRSLDARQRERVFWACNYAQSARVAILCADRKCLLAAVKRHLEPYEKWYRAALVSREFAHLEHALWADANTVLFTLTAVAINDGREYGWFVFTIDCRCCLVHARSY
jgi:hypothetical protein